MGEWTQLEGVDDAANDAYDAYMESQRARLCPVHGEPWVTPDAPDGHRRCTFYVPALGASEDYGCPQPTTRKGSTNE